MFPEYFYSLFIKLFSLSLCILLGFFGGRFKNINQESIATLVFYFISPIMFFTSSINAKFTIETLKIITLIFTIIILMAIFVGYISKFYFSQNEQNILLFTAGTSNCGFLLLPIAAEILEQNVNRYLVYTMAVMLFENTIGKYICFKDQLSFKTIVKDLFRAPSLIAFLCGTICSISQITLPEIFDEFVFQTRSSFTFLGTIIIGLNLSKISSQVWEVVKTKKLFITFMISTKLIIQPIFFTTLILINRLFFNFLSEYDIKCITILTFAPIASSVFSYSKYLKINHDAVSVAITTSIFLSIFIIPFITSFFLF